MCWSTSASTRSSSRGAGFDLLVAEGDTVAAGQQLIVWSPAEVSDGGRSPLVPVVALDLGPKGLEELVRPGTLVQAGDPLFRLPVTLREVSDAQVT